MLCKICSCSCGLFTLNNAKYWIGEELSDTFTQVRFNMSITQFVFTLSITTNIFVKNIQEDMTNFRLKLASILLTTELNKASWQRQAEQQDDGSTSDIQIVESIENDYTPKDSYKRKRTPSLFKNNNEDGLSEEIDNKKVIYIYPHIIYI
jgi:hypothetical protein